MSGDILSGARTCVMEGHAAGARRDAVAVMTALRGYGGLNFSMACEVLIRDFDDIYPEWAQLAKIAWSLYLWQQRGFSLQNRIKTAQRSLLGIQQLLTSVLRKCAKSNLLYTGSRWRDFPCLFWVFISFYFKRANGNYLISSWKHGHVHKMLFATPDVFFICLQIVLF